MPPHFQLAWTLVRAVAGLLGLTFLYMALFMYQDDRGKLQNRLVDLWLAVQAREESSLAYYAAFIRRASELALLGLNRLFGERLLHARAIAISFALSICSGCLLLAASRLQATFSPLPLMVFGIIFGFYGFVLGPYLFRQGRTWLGLIMLNLLWVLPLLAYCLVEGQSDFGSLRDSLEILGLGVLFLLVACGLFGLLCDLLLLAVNRLLIRAMAKTTSAAFLVAGLAYNLIWTFILADSLLFVIYPDHWKAQISILVGRLTNTGVPQPDPEKGTRLLTFMFAYLLSTNLFTLLTASSVLLIIIIAIAHRFTWPIAGRAINAIYEWEIISSRKVQFSAATAFLLFSIPRLSTLFAIFK